jgi:hypothetical protein
MRRTLSILAALVALASNAACSRTAASPAESASATEAPGGATLELSATSRTVGSAVRVSASGLPAGKTVDLTWKTVEGGWVIEDYYHFRGKKYVEATLSLGRFTVDANGRLEGRFSIPEDYGGIHDVVALIDGKAVAQNGIEVTQSFEMTPASGPVGTPIEIRVKGLGWRTMESTWVVNWDNNLVGFVSAAGTKGSAVARFRAAGPAGTHVVRLLTGYQGQGYLNYEQSPIPHLPRPQFMFTTTAAPSVAATVFAEPYPRQPVPKPELSIGNATLALTPTQGPVGTRTRLQGTGFPAGATLQLVWQTYTGSRVSGEGYGPQDNSIGTVTVGRDGRIDAPVTVPDDLGGMHGLALRESDRTLARAFFAIETSIVSISPASGPVGTPIRIHLKGVGWTEYDNIYVATYDNRYMGYVCGFNSQGDVVINFTATGEPGRHIIDLYPGIYQGPPTEPQLLYRQPQLTYADDHPGNKIPALRFAFDITR